MNSDVEELLRTGELLREGMERFTSDMRAPAGLIQRADRRRRRRLMVRSGSGLTAALAAGVVAIVSVGTPGSHHRVDADPALTTASVVARIDRALSNSAAGDVAQLRVSVSMVFAAKAVTLTALEWFYARRWRAVAKTGSGRLLTDESTVSTASGTGLTLVDYGTRTWGREIPVRPPFRVVQPAPVPASCSGPAYADPFAGIVPGDAALVGSLSGTTSASMAQDLRTAVSCGTLTMAGRQYVDGVDAIKLTSAPKSLIGETIWVSPRSYLPVRVIIMGAYSLAGQPIPGGREAKLTADFSWLRPTPRNVATLIARIPAGFRQVPLVTALRAVVDQLVGEGSCRQPSVARCG